MYVVVPGTFYLVMFRRVDLPASRFVLLVGGCVSSDRHNRVQRGDDLRWLCERNQADPRQNGRYAK